MVSNETQQQKETGEKRTNLIPVAGGPDAVPIALAPIAVTNDRRFSRSATRLHLALLV